MAVTRSQVMTALKDYLDGGALATAIAAVNAEVGGPILPSPVFYHFGERIIDKKLKPETWVVCIAYDSKSTLEDHAKFRIEDWSFVIVGVAHHLKQITINKWVLKIEEALVRALDAQSIGAEIKWFGLNPETIKDMEITGSGVSPIELVGNTYFMEAAVELRFRAAVGRA